MHVDYQTVAGVAPWMGLVLGGLMLAYFQVRKRR